MYVCRSYDFSGNMATSKKRMNFRLSEKLLLSCYVLFLFLFLFFK